MSIIREFEDYWTYQTADLGRSGSVYVSDYNGSFTYIHEDAGTAGNRMQAGVSHVYSYDRTYFGGSYGNMKLGIGFRFDLLEKVETISSTGDYAALYEAGYRMKYIDADGTVHYFKSTDTADKYEYEADSNLTITKQSSGRYLMEDDADNRKEFSVGGYLLSISDANGNEVSITYSNNRITKVTDGAGKVITLEYDDSNYLTAIKDPAGRAVTFSYYGECLRYITYPDGKTTYFWYTNPGARMSQITAHDTSVLLITLKNVTSKSKTFYRVSTLEMQSQASSDGTRSTVNKMSYDFSGAETVIQDQYGKKNVISFDSAGRTVNVIDQESNAAYAKYNSSGNKKNTLAVASDTFSSINNLVKNNSAELTGSEWYQQISGSSAAGSTAVTTDQYHTGYKSFYVNSTSSSGRVNYCQAFTGVPGTTYTLSAYTKLTADTEGSGGVCLGFCYKDGTGVWKTVHGSYITETQDWNWESYTFTLPSDAMGNMGIMLMVLDAEGTAYFDSVQLETGDVMNRYNLLENSGFQYNASYWSFSGKGTSDGIVSGYNGNGQRLCGAPGTKKNLYQDVQINGKKGEKVVFGGWARADAAGQTNTVAADTKFKVTLTITYTDGTKAYASELFNKDVSTAQYVCSSYTLQKDCSYIRYYLTYYNDINQVVFDDACLYLDLYGSSYQYDSSGKLTAVSDGSGQSISYTYDGPDITKISQKFDGEEKESCSYTYDSKHNILTETTKGGVVTKYDYTAQSGTTSTYGNPTKVTVKNADGTLQSQNEFVYTSDYDYLIAVKDARGGTTTYDYDTVKGVLRSVTDAEGNQTSYTYDAATDLLLSVSGKADADTTADAAYEYKNDRLSSISHNGFSYGFAYDLQGRLVSVSLGGKNLITHSYNANGTVNVSTYGNGDRVSYTYDSLDRVKTESYDGVKTYEYFYNKEGQVAQVEDYENALCTAYEYDFAKRLSAIHTSNGLNAEFAYDERNNLKSWKTEKNGVLLTDAAFTYKTDGLMEGAELPLLKAEVSYQHDGLNRTTETKLVLQSGEEVSSSYAIPKDNGKTRPLSIYCYEDKIMQEALRRILEAVFEPMFYDEMMGFRPDKGCHKAIKMLNTMIERKYTNYILDADIKGFFNHLNHKWLMKFVETKIKDPNILRLTRRMIKAGVVENYIFEETEEGSGQGSLCSPILANIYMHYVLLWWFKERIQPNLRGFAGIVVYADDFVICFQHKDEAEMFCERLKHRMNYFGLELEEDKTRLIPFGRLYWKYYRERGMKAETFTFLGFTHYCSQSRNGKFRVKRKTSSKKLAKKCREMNKQIREMRPYPIKEIICKLNQMLVGYYHYYGITDNISGIDKFYQETRRRLFYWLNRRGQRNSYTWNGFLDLLKQYPLAKPRLYVNIYDN